jgi:hypothetical protein
MDNIFVNFLIHLEPEKNFLSKSGLFFFIINFNLNLFRISLALDYLVLSGVVINVIDY